MITKEQIKTARDRLGESQTEFAVRFGVVQTTIHRWENRGIPEHGPTRILVEEILRKLNKRPFERVQRSASA